MSHKKLGAVKKKLRSARYDRAELLSLIKFLLALIQSAHGKTSLTKAQRRSLAITEQQLGIRQTKPSRARSRKRGKKQRTTTRPKRTKSKSRTAHQKRFAALARKYHGRIPKGTKV